MTSGGARAAGSSRRRCSWLLSLSKRPTSCLRSTPSLQCWPSLGIRSSSTARMSWRCLAFARYISCCLTRFTSCDICARALRHCSYLPPRRCSRANGCMSALACPWQSSAPCFSRRLLLPYGSNALRAQPDESSTDRLKAIRSTGGVRIRKLDKAGRSETRPRIPGHLAEPPPLLPVGACVGDLLRRARHEVPPHQNLFWKWWAADQQQSATRTTGETDLGTVGAKVVQHSLLQRLPVEAAIAI